jgi:predicted Rossmann fold flavoprotein
LSLNWGNYVKNKMGEAMYDVIVIGGGPAGLMAAASAGIHGARTLLVDKGDKLGRKLGISGGGRCNVTNAGEIDAIIKNIPGNGRFLYSSFSIFNNRDIIQFFEDIGIKLKEEDRGRMFPVSNKAKDVVQALIHKVKQVGVDIRTNTPVGRIQFADGKVTGIQLQSGETISSQQVIVAVGGMSVPYTGSTGDGYAWARAAGHTITDLFPTEVPITSNEPFIRDKSLQGLSLRNIVITVHHPAKKKKVISHEGDIIFTHFGISGPAALRCSQFVLKTQKQTGIKEIELTIDLFPDKNADTLYNELINLAKNEPKKAFKNVIKGFIPERMIPLFLQKADLPEEVTYANLPKEPLLKLSQFLKEFPIQVNGTLSIEEAFVTGGGVSLKEIDPKTMQSKITNGLYFCGEILDIHGYTGGFNITAAFSTGYVAGKSATEAKTLLFPAK